MRLHLQRKPSVARTLVAAAVSAAFLAFAGVGTANAVTKTGPTPNVAVPPGGGGTVIGDYVSWTGCEAAGVWGQAFGEWSNFSCVAVQEPGDDEPWYRLYVY